jgi:hypothetical protein
MNLRVLHIESVAGTTLLLRFTNGELRRFHAAAFLLPGTVFAALRDPAVFSAARVVAGAVEWPGEVDLSHDTLYLHSVAVDEHGKAA